MLLSAADEYITAARGMSALLVRNRREADVQQYHKLMATGLGCMDTVLRDFNMLPRDEARLRHRYASLLIEETDNTTEIDEVLSKQIALCGRCRLQDLKYAALHLQARYQFKTNHRAALKSLDKHISEAETFQHIAWVYAFRFLKVSLAFQIPGRIDLVSAVQQLRAIAAHAKHRGHIAVYMTCNILEALAHLRSDAADKLSETDKAMAAARSQQLHLAAHQLGSFGTLLNMIDLVCCIQKGETELKEPKKSSALMDGALEGANASAWLSDTGIVTVAIEGSSGGGLTTDTGGIFRKNLAGRDELVFSWLPKNDLSTLCTYICGLDQHTQTKGFVYIKDAHLAAKLAVERPMSHNFPVFLAVARRDWNDMLDWHALFAIGLMACYGEDQARANEALSILKQRALKLPRNGDAMYTCTLLYLTAVCEQRDGSFDSALHTYSSSAFQLPEPGSAANAKSDLAILAALNRLLIIRVPGHPQHDTVTSLFAQLRPLCENHPSQYMRMAYRLAHAMSHPEASSQASIARRKTYIQMAVNAANALFHNTGNRQFVTMALPFFSESFFQEMSNEKRTKAVQTMKNSLRYCRSSLWMAVAAGMYIQSFQMCGFLEEAQEAQRDYESLVPKLPAPLLGRADVDAEGEDDDAEGEDDDAEGEDDDE
jgi:hypothetical protein